MKGEWGQLTYASAKGGFGVQAEAGLDDDDRDALVQGTYAGRSSFGQTIPLLADEAEIAAFHRNLSYRWNPDVGGCYWHSAPAGADESGRTGNCFVHALADKGGGWAPHLRGDHVVRPIDLWRSPSFLTPFGIAAVSAAELPPMPPVPGGTTSPREIVDFIASLEVDRMTTFRRLAQEVTRDRNRPIILGVESPDEGALWIASVSSLLAPPAARAFSFSVWEAPELLTHDLLPDRELICVSEAELPGRVADLDALVLVTSDPQPLEPDLTDEAGVFAELAMYLFSQDVERVIELLEEIEKVSLLVDVEASVRMWPLAITMARRMSDWPDDIKHAISGVLLTQTPTTIADSPELWRLTEDLVKQRSELYSPQLSQARADVRTASPGPVRNLLHQAYVERAAQDGGWLADPSNRTPSVRTPQEVIGLGEQWFVDARVAAKSENPVRSALNLTWLVDFLLAEGWNGRFDNEFWDDLRAVLAHRYAQHEYLQALGPVAETTKTMVRQVVSQWVRSQVHTGVTLGQVLIPELAEWLVPWQALADQTPDLSQELVAEALFHATRGPEGAGLGSSLVHGLLTQPRLADVALEPLVARLDGYLLPASDVFSLLKCYGARVPGRLRAEALATVPVAAFAELIPCLIEVEAADTTGGNPLVARLSQAGQTPLADVLRTESRVAATPEGVARHLILLLQELQESATSQEISGHGRLSEAWIPHFDVWSAVSNVSSWARDRQSLFGTAQAPEGSLDRVMQWHDMLLRSRDGNHRLRRGLVHRLVFSEFFIDQFPEHIQGLGRTSRGPDLPRPAFAGLTAALIERGYPVQDLVEAVEDCLLYRRHWGPMVPLPTDATDKERDRLFDRAYTWVNEAAGHKQTLGTRLKGMRLRRR